MNEWVNHKGVCGTAPATPGWLIRSNRLLFDIVFVKHQICNVNLYWNKPLWLFTSKKFWIFPFFRFGNWANSLYFTDLWGVRAFSNYYLCSICAKCFFVIISEQHFIWHGRDPVVGLGPYRWEWSKYLGILIFGWIGYTFRKCFNALAKKNIYILINSLLLSL